MDNVQEHNICTNVPSSQTFRSYLLSSGIENTASFEKYIENHARGLDIA
jgi:hypothetical protein